MPRIEQPIQRPLGVQISRALSARGVRTVFGIPGVHNIELYRGMAEAGLTHVLVRHEQGAGFMADGYARATGRPGVAHVITGPGVCNVMTAMGQAYSDSVPMLVLSSCLPRADRHMGRGRLHEMRDQETAAACVCDWSVTAPDAAGTFDLIDRAFDEFACRRARPKHIQIPLDLLAAPAGAPPVVRPAPALPIASAPDLDEIAARLKEATRPLFIFGGGAVRGFQAARALLAATGGACFVTTAGRGVIAANDSHNFGPTLPRGDSAAVIASADLVLAIGTALSEVDLWRDRLGRSAPLVRIDIDPDMLTDAHRAELRVLGDAGPVMEALLARLQGQPPASGWDAAEIARLRRSFRASTDAERPGLVPVIDAVTTALPPETMVYTDMTQFAYVANEIVQPARPGLWHHPSGFGTLGYALPAAIGGKIGLGRAAPVVAIAGDYGFHTTMQELGVAVEHRLNLPVLLWDNGRLGEIEDCMTNAQITPIAVAAQNPDFCALARAFGAKAVRPNSLGGLQDALTRALHEDGPTLVHMTPAML